MSQSGSPQVRVGLDWKYFIFSKVSWNEFDSLNPRIKRVRVGLKVDWSATHQQQYC